MRIERDLSRLDQAYDVIVIGAGITGVCVARETSGRGLRTLVLDKGDFGHGTSSATSKYIHGGIRYLETYEFGVVRESLRERRVLALAAPHLVSQQRFLMPAWKWSKPPTALIGAGVGLYAALGFDRNRYMPDAMRIPLPRWIPRRRLLRDVPWLDPNELQGALAYHDTFNTHPERLLLELLKSAVAAGTVALNYVEAAGFIYDSGADDPAADAGAHTGVTVKGVELVDRRGGGRYTVRGRAVVNAAGPWIDLVLCHVSEQIGVPLGVSVKRSKGVHLLTRPIGGTSASGAGTVTDTVFARARSGNHVIVSPWQGYSFIGPTDTAIDVSPDSVKVDHSDVELILGTVNDTIAAAYPKLTEADVEGVTVGIRPLIVDEANDSYTTSRRHELYDHAPSGVRHLWSIGGGKCTTGRALGVETAEALARSDALDGAALRPFDSKRLAVQSSFGWAHDPQPYFDSVIHSRGSLPLEAATRVHLARLYGTEHHRILDLVEREPALAQRLSDDPRRLDIAAQAVYAVTEESACTLPDLLDRRLVIGTLGRVTRLEVERVAAAAAPLLGWTPDEAATAVETELARRAVLEFGWRTPAS